ncbi:hypothetical protein D3C86_1564410 [compost metagenome]
MQRLKEHVAANLSNWRKLGKTIDHSEIELYFRIALTTRLGLRDQPTVQVYPKFAQWVTSEMLNEAQSNVLADQTALLPLYLNTQPYWQRFLAFHRSAQVNAINAWRDRIGEYLDLLTDNQWLPDRMPEGDAERLLQVLVDSGQPASTAVGQPLSKTQYEAAYAALLRRVEQAMLALTQAVLAEHATDPTEPTPGPSSRP